MASNTRSAKPGSRAPVAAAEKADAQFSMTASREFAGWLAEARASLALSTYQSGKVILIGSDPETKRLSISGRAVPQPMGLAFDGRRLAVASMVQITVFVDAGQDGVGPDGYDAVYVPQLAYYTADLNVHDVAFNARGEIVFLNTLFSCLCAASPTHSFRPLWRPPFISRLAAEDRCHLNGLALRDGEPAFATAVGETDVADGWRDNRRAGGVVVDIQTDEVVCRGLSMPHSPRWHDGSLFVLNSGTGEFGKIDLSAKRFEPIAFCPGFLRGLTFIGKFAVVGLSAPREDKTFAGLPLHERLATERVEPRCAIYVIDTTTGDIAHWLRIEGVVRELYDVVVLPQIARPSMVGFLSEEIRRAVSIEGAS